MLKDLPINLQARLSAIHDKSEKTMQLSKSLEILLLLTQSRKSIFVVEVF